MYRILQSLERDLFEMDKEPINQTTSKSNTINVENGSNPSESVGDENTTSTTGTSGKATRISKSGSKRINPHKYLLYRPTFAQLMLYISTAYKVKNIQFSSYSFY